jgi:LytS/YehU family sensor histidine kinase
MIAHYLEIEQIRMVNGFDYDILVEAPLDTNAVKVPPGILQPFVENSILHGIRTLENKTGGIVIGSYISNVKNLTIEIKDNGKGFDQVKVLPASERHGTDITKERLLLLEELYGQKVKIEITSSQEGATSGTLVAITIDNIISKIY